MPATRLRLDFGVDEAAEERSYDIRIGAGIWGGLPAELEKLGFSAQGVADGAQGASAVASGAGAAPAAPGPGTPGTPGTPAAPAAAPAAAVGSGTPAPATPAPAVGPGSAPGPTAAPAPAPGRSLMLLSDESVADLHADAVAEVLRAAGYRLAVMTVPTGEACKTLAVAEQVWARLAAERFHRDDVILALGGGAVLDLGGFVASTWMRGISCIYLPTTLLAMADAAVGGKTAVDLAAGKNLVGTFAQPRFVCAELQSLVTLPLEQWANGWAEVVKHAIISGPEDWDWLSAQAAPLHDQALPENEYLALVQEALVRTVRLKAQIVSSDEREQGIRIFLNYGHSFAHALEKISGYTLLHGVAVAEGIRFAARLAVEAIGASSLFAADQDSLLAQLGLPPLPHPVPASVSADELLAAMLGDKKADAQGLRMVFASAPGQMQAVRVDPDLLRIYLKNWVEMHS